MTYVKSWDETSPAGASTPADTIDTEIQDLKVAIRERLEDFFPDWSDDGVDPKPPNIAFADLPLTRAKVGLTVDENIAASTNTPIPWDSAEYDTGSYWSAGDPTKLIVPADGVYIVIASIRWAQSAATTDFTRVHLLKGGTTILVSDFVPQGSSTTVSYNNISWVGTLSAGDALTIEGFATSSGGLDVTTSQTFFSILRIA